MLDTSQKTAPLYYEDIEVGMRFRSDELAVAAEDIKAFARQFDPQPFHLDEELARETFFGGLAASGWHTAALTMRLLTSGAMPISWGIIGAGVDELRWPTPLRPRDSVHVECEVIERRPLKSRPDIGLIRVRTITYNQKGEVVQSMTPNMLVPQREPRANSAHPDQPA